MKKSKGIVFLFPGQGAQYPGMGLDMAEVSAGAKEVFAAASDILGLDLAALIRDSDEETLKRTDISQPAISAVSLAAAAFLKERGIVPGACAGFSLGEYPALVCASVISMEDCFRLTKARGRAMQDAVNHIRDRITRNAAGGGAVDSGAEDGCTTGGATDSGATAPPGMAAVLGLPSERVEALIAEWKGTNSPLEDLYPANINSPKQTVVSGSAAALEEAKKRFIEAGARRVLRLAVAGPFHSPFMKEAAEAFAPALEQTAFADPLIPLFSNVTGGQVSSGAEAKSLALRQIVEGVRWIAEERALAELKPEVVLETGPGSVLQGLWRDRGSEIPAYGAGTVKEIMEFLSEYSV
ncbi:MAG: ACP S-malonyltransferase [Treponema sp.]|jgi:[acyl-carrier-protein] S-malonyltransferase|nr:ACP S-malonyltransferase [Treponema sp.]